MLKHVTLHTIYQFITLLKKLDHNFNIIISDIFQHCTYYNGRMIVHRDCSVTVHNVC